jgi:hypothetical protein
MHHGFLAALTSYQLPATNHCLSAPFARKRDFCVPRFYAGSCKSLCSLSLTRFLQNAPKTALCFLSLTDTQTRNYLCSLSLTRFHQYAPKTAQCFLSLTDTQTCNYLCSLSLTKKPGCGVPRRDHLQPACPLVRAGRHSIRNTANYLCYVPLTRFRQNASKNAQCFLSLTATQTCKYLCYVPLTKNTGRGAKQNVARVPRTRGFLADDKFRDQGLPAERQGTRTTWLGIRYQMGKGGLLRDGRKWGIIDWFWA